MERHVAFIWWCYSGSTHRWAWHPAEHETLSVRNWNWTSRENDESLSLSSSSWRKHAQHSSLSQLRCIMFCFKVCIVWYSNINRMDNNIHRCWVFFCQFCNKGIKWLSLHFTTRFNKNLPENWFYYLFSRLVAGDLLLINTWFSQTASS